MTFCLVFCDLQDVHKSTPTHLHNSLYVATQDDYTTRAAEQVLQNKFANATTTSLVVVLSHSKILLMEASERSICESFFQSVVQLLLRCIVG